MQHFIKNLKLFVVLFIITGIIYPLIIFILGKALFPYQANGSLVYDKDNQIIGSQLITPNFTSDRYFHPRTSSATVTDGIKVSSPSNLAVIDPKYKNSILQNIAALNSKEAIASDLVTTSGSGLDPHISLENALYQTERIAKARKLKSTNLQEFVTIYANQRYINVLLLNIELEELENGHK